jgi:ankyrin repeat protein
VNHRDEFLGTPLAYAAMHQNLPLMRELLARGADPNLGRKGHRPLDAALLLGHLEVAQLLLEAGANPNLPGVADCLPLIETAERGKTEHLRLLLEYGADVNARDALQRSALALCAARGDVEAVRLLLDHGADVNAGDELGTALNKAAQGRHAAVVRLLIERGADLDATTSLGIPVYYCLDAEFVEQAGVKEIVGDRIAPEPPAGVKALLERMKRSGPTPSMGDLLQFADELRKPRGPDA